MNLGILHLIFTVIFAVMVLLPVPVLRGVPLAEGVIDSATAEEITKSFNAGMQAFEKQQWTEAITNLEKAISLVEGYPDKKATETIKSQFVRVYFILGAAAFNQHDYPKSIKSFETFISKWPMHAKVPEARLAIARATFMNKDYERAAGLFAEMEKYPTLRDQSLAIQAECYKETGKTAEMTTVLEKLISGGINTTIQAGGGLQLAQMFADEDKLDELGPLLDQLLTRKQFVVNIVALNAIVVKLGDSLADNGQFEKASRIYLKVMPPDQVKEFQSQRIDFLERRMADNAAAAQANPQASLSILGQNADLQPVLDQAKTLLAEFEKMPDYMPGLMLRNARCWIGREKNWESIIVNERLLKRYPDAKIEREAALLGIVVTYSDMVQVKLCQQACEAYLKEFPKGTNVGTVVYIKGSVAMQAGDIKGAADIFGALVEEYPDSALIDQMYLMLGTARFSLGEMDAALKAFKRYIEKFPTGASIMEAKYRAAIIPVFQGKYEEGWKVLEAFLKESPASQFAEDAKYRLMICKYAASLYDEVLKDVEAWEKAQAGAVVESEVLSLKGDCLAALLKNEEAAQAYMAAVKKASADEVLNYALNEASKLLQKLGDTARLSKMWEDFIAEKPEHPSIVAGIYWIGKAKTRDGKVDEAKAIIVEQLKRCLNNQKNESVEMLLQQLAQLCWKRPRLKGPAPAPAPAPAPDPFAPPAADDKSTVEARPPEPPVPPPLPPWDAMAELEEQMEPLKAIAEATGRARLNFARIELLKLLKCNADAEALTREIAATKPELLSPQLLAFGGEYLQGKKLDAEATVLYTFLKENYLKSGMLDYAYSGLGGMAMAKGDTKTALQLYTLAADEYAGAKIKESTLGKAQALLESGRPAESKKLFEMIAGNREWRGDCTAQAVYSLGEVERTQGHLAEAVAHYQRVFVAYQKYLPWVAKSYIKAAECFDKLGKRKEAVAHLQELLRNEKLATFPENALASKMLREWGGSL